ncbi:MAG: DUF1206 domain-containing protein [Polyangiales bacterium]
MSQDLGRGVVYAARVGYAAKGVVYGVVGFLALLAALGESGGKLTDSHGAISEIGRQPYGQVLLWITALGLVCYALWKGVCAVLDPEQEGTDRKGAAKRAGYAFSSVLHFALAFSTARAALGSGRSGGGTKSTVAELMSLPMGRVLIAIAGAIAIGFGVQQMVLAVKGKVGEQYASAPLNGRLRQTVLRVARVGVFARGLVFPVIGASFVMAALRGNASKADGMGEALGDIAQGPFGRALITFVAAGLLAYGVHLFFVARYGRLPEPRMPGERQHAPQRASAY